MRSERRLPLAPDLSEKTLRLALVATVLATVTRGPVLASDWYVDLDNANCPGTGRPTDPFCAIADAVAVASDGDTIHIAAGRYHENLALDKDLTLIGTEGQAVTFIDGGGGQRVLTIPSGTTIALDGLAITGGHVSGDGGGIHASDATLTLTRCAVRGNTISTDVDLHYRGAGIAAVNCQLTMIQSMIAENHAYGAGCITVTQTVKGGGIFAQGGTLALLDSIVSLNSIGGAYEHYGAGFYAEGCTVEVESSTICSNSIGNTCNGWGQGGGIWTDSGSITDSILSGNWPDQLTRIRDGHLQRRPGRLPRGRQHRPRSPVRRRREQRLQSPTALAVYRYR